MAKIGRSLQDLAAEIERRAEAKRDFIAPVPKFELAVVDDKPAIAIANGTLHQFGINDLAHGQIAEYAGIPMAYYRRMLADDPKLLIDNINRWLKDKAKDARMLRTLDGKLRAFLSNSFRQLENEDLADAVLPVLLQRDLMILSCEITDRRLYIKAVDRTIEESVPTGKMMGDGGHTIFDTISPAITISNSEVGSGSLLVEYGVWTKACTNLASFGANMRRAHLGKRAELSDDVYEMLTDNTKRLTNEAVWAQTTDMVAACFERAKFAATAQRLGQAAADQVPAENVIEVVERVGRRFSFNEGERKGVLAALIAGGDLSRYGVHSAITRYSQEDAVAYDRATEFERIGGEVIEMAPAQWREVATVAKAEKRELVAA